MHTTQKQPDISIVIPLYNEEESVDLLTERIIALIDKHPLTFEVILIDDGSQDHTAERIKQIAMKDPRFQAIFLSRNFGHQIALTAGLRYITATQGAMVMDGDLQDPPEMFETFYQRLKEGFEVVYAIRKTRKSSWLLKISYLLFYRIMQKSSYIDIPVDCGDFSLMSRRVVNYINSMPEESRFLRGMRAWVGFRQIGILVDRPGRELGKSKYSLWRLISLALNGIFNFSKYPIRFTMVLGMVAMLVAIIYFAVTLTRKMFIGDVPSGFTALLFMIIFMSGVQLIAIAIIGEYILRIFFQVKNRPLYIIRERIRDGKVIEECGTDGL